MLNKQEKSRLRGDLFRQLDGLVVAPVAYCLLENGVIAYLQEASMATVESLAKQFKANEGYLNVALRLIAAQGWIDYWVEEGMPNVKCNEYSVAAFEHFYLYKEVVELLHYSGKFHSRKFEVEPFKKLEGLFNKYQAKFDLAFSEDEQIKSIQEQILKHIEGHLVGPTIVRLGMGGMFHKYFMEASFRADEYHQHPESFTIILEFLHNLGWFNKKGDHFSFTDTGLFFAKRASAYGVTVSYMPMFRQMQELLFGNSNVLWETPPNSKEIHVDREMNVWGSGGAHSAYFKKIDQIVIDLFNRPLEEQPKGIIDIGCGNGAFLIHLFETIEQKTLRGEHLDNHPLFLVGADYNKAALKVTRANLIQADIWAKVLFGDISDPDGLQADLNENYNIDLKDLLCVRTFLDHNRIWSEPEAEITLNQPSPSTGAFAYRGKLLANDMVEKNLKSHFGSWKPYISKYGLIVIELHTIATDLIAQNLGKTAATAYDATHGFSDQYILEIDSFLKVLAEIGLKSDEKFFAKFPNSDLATVSVNYIVEQTKT